jgi:uncharacterized protein YuzE
MRVSSLLQHEDSSGSLGGLRRVARSGQTVPLVCAEKNGVRTCFLSDENTQLNIDKDGNICAMTIEHARDRADISCFSFELIAA